MEAQLVRLAIGRRDAAVRAAHAQFQADVRVILDAHGVTDGKFVGEADGSVALVPASSAPESDA